MTFLGPLDVIGAVSGTAAWQRTSVPDHLAAALIALWNDCIAVPISLRAGSSIKARFSEASCGAGSCHARRAIATSSLSARFLLSERKPSSTEDAIGFRRLVWSYPRAFDRGRFVCRTVRSHLVLVSSRARLPDSIPLLRPEPCTLP